MRILGIDPGGVSGWCLYCSTTRTVLRSGNFATHLAPAELLELDFDRCCIERVVPFGASYPQVVDAAYTCGRLAEVFFRACEGQGHPVELTRQDVRRRLQEATHGAIRVKDDASVWAALKALHGEERRTPRDGPLGALWGSGSHGRAACAVAVAYLLPGREEAVPEKPGEESWW
jgi:hypothetical protein